MNKKMYQTLEFNKVLSMLEELALSEKAGSRIRNLEPYLSEAEVSLHLNETTESRLILEQYGNPPLSPMTDLEKSLNSLGKGIFLLPEQLGDIAQFLTACRRLRSYLKKAEATATSVASYGNSIYDLSELEEEINRSVRGSQLDDRASPKLADLRRKIICSGDQVRSKLESLLRNNGIWFSESFVSIRNGRYTLPVKREFKNHVVGTVIDVSQSGGTYFIEPSAARKLQEEIGILRIEEDNEVRRILFTLTALVEDHLSSIRINMEAMVSLDFLFAKAKLSIAMKANPLSVQAERKIEIRGGRHPLLKSDTVIPLDFHIGDNFRGVVITGPNTGGKTVALKTIGLLSLMAQSGLHVPASDGYFTMNNYVLCDIGDGQSITENLSTFSSHMTNIIGILKTADDQSLVLLDELGSGTDPAEGMGLAIAILEELAQKKCLFVSTTHYPEIKDFAKAAPDLINARMAFDRQTLLPLYRLEIGEAGESCALYIAKRLGLPQHMITRASTAAYGNIRQNIGLDQGASERSIIENQNRKFDVKLDLMPGMEDSTILANSIVTDSTPRRIKKQEAAKVPEAPRSMKFNIGDSVTVYPQKMIGIVCQKADEKGDIGIQVKKRKLMINHKRLKLLVPANELYPENYDFSIVFDSVTNRKARHVMEKRHDPELVINLLNEERELQQ